MAKKLAEKEVDINRTGVKNEVVWDIGIKIC
jgi:hypothetical protein